MLKNPNLPIVTLFDFRDYGIVRGSREQAIGNRNSPVSFRIAKVMLIIEIYDLYVQIFRGLKLRSSGSNNFTFLIQNLYISRLSVIIY